MVVHIRILDWYRYSNSDHHRGIWYWLCHVGSIAYSGDGVCASTKPHHWHIWKETMISIVSGDSEHVLKKYPDNTFHACITDPPYGMGMEHWDHSVPEIPLWK